MKQSKDSPEVLGQRKLAPNKVEQPDGQQKQTKFKIVKKSTDLAHLRKKKTPVNLAIDTINKMSRNDQMSMSIGSRE